MGFFSGILHNKCNSLKQINVLYTSDLHISGPIRN